jgi:hypothetical protein
MWALFATGGLGAIVVHVSDLSAAHAPACYQGILARQEIVEFIRGEPAVEKIRIMPASADIFCSPLRGNVYEIEAFLPRRRLGSDLSKTAEYSRTLP